ncbi:Pyrimidine 5'-nucleotidase YjjG [Marinomonas spartinae]|uniref:pyrimidine 5'-nucleotidase n=1 Tax=Marinomonas spartinae TaxID=1792290 RepID=UPI000808DD06|nr:pyrimidine 5'-nucleotidase [Marinomonas spartinae]SBS38028.1 Pyrimidine 5'-nucleotidase YjjG [Marinomonas spartinae]
MYQWIIFDADDTLFHFDNFVGLVHMMTKYGVEFTERDFNDYQSINKPLWVEYQNQAITAEQLQTRRFQTWADKLSVSAQQLNHDFLQSMAEICQALPGAKELVDYLESQKVNMAIITNGFTQLQKTRLERTGFHRYFSPVVISEQLGIAKPNRKIFDHTLTLMDNPDRSKVLMVGDTLASDILGGINAELDTCWINHHNDVHPEHIKPTYQARSLLELKNILESVL